MANLFDNFGGIINNTLNGPTSLLGFMAHPMQSILFLIGGFFLLIILYKIIIA